MIMFYKFAGGRCWIDALENDPKIVSNRENTEPWIEHQT